MSTPSPMTLYLRMKAAVTSDNPPKEVDVIVFRLQMVQELERLEATLAGVKDEKPHAAEVMGRRVSNMRTMLTEFVDWYINTHELET